MKVRYDDLFNALEYTSAGAPLENQAFLDRQTGHIYYKSESYDSDEDLPADVDDSSKFLLLPDRKDLELGARMVFRYVDQVMPDQYGHVRDMFNRRGAYSRFKNFLVRHGRLDEWHAFDEQETLKALSDWCSHHGVELTGLPPPRPSATPSKGGNGSCPVRAVERADSARWLQLRQALWPQQGTDELRLDIERYFAGTCHYLKTVLVAETADAGICGFAELNIRSLAAGCRGERIAFLEGWYVDPAVRRQGVGAALIAAAEKWAVDARCTEFASDVETGNDLGNAAHAGVGFEAVETVRCYRKQLA